MKPSYTQRNRPTVPILLLAVFMTVTQVLTSSAQGGNYVEGSCKDENGAPMIGVAVTIPGTQQGVSTDLNGTFSIKAAENNLFVSGAIHQFLVIGNLTFHIRHHIGSHKRNFGTIQTDAVAVGGFNIVQIKRQADIEI